MFLTKLIFLAFLLGFVNSCIFSYKNTDNVSRREAYKMVKAKEKPVARIQSKSHPDCICGTDSHPYDFRKPWILYIHFKTPKGNRTCPGTIINSNMVVTSNRCLARSDQVQRNFPTIAQKVMDVPKVEELTLSTHINLGEKGEYIFNLSKVIYRDEYPAEILIKKVKAPESDVAILIVKGVDFNSPVLKNPKTNVILGPICVPRWNDIPFEMILNREGFYQGVRGWDDYKYKYESGVGNFSNIMSAKECNKRSGLNIRTGSDDSLCLNFYLPGPTIEGGPLRLTATRWQAEEAPARSYLIGLASYVDRTMKNARQKYAYFANINSNIRYIEEKALEEKSEWCNTPPYFEKSWPWESFTEMPDQSLDCDCGTELSPSLGRVFGGAQANKTEFPWLVKLSIPQLLWYESTDKRWQVTYGTPKLCAGTVLNSKIILTAASCVTNSTRMKLSGSYFNVLDHLDWSQQVPGYENTAGEHYQIYLRAYHQNSDADAGSVKVKAEKIIFHPGYIADVAKDRYNFDIALIVLNQNIKDHLVLKGDAGKKTAVRQVCLPKPGDLEFSMINKKTATVAGWGGEFASGAVDTPPPDTLTKAEVQLYPLELCNNRSRYWNLQTNFTSDLQPPADTMFCGGSYPVNEKFPMKSPLPIEGDIGAPLTISKNGAMTQIGIFSYYTIFVAAQISGVDILVGPTYYVNVEAFLPFINYYSKQVGAKGCRQKG